MSFFVVALWCVVVLGVCRRLVVLYGPVGVPLLLVKMYESFPLNSIHVLTSQSFPSFCPHHSWVWLQICFMGPSSIFGCRKDSSSSPSSSEDAVSALIRRKYKALGCLRFNEVAVMSLFFILFLLWFSRSPGFVDGYAVLFKGEMMMLGWGGVGGQLCSVVRGGAQSGCFG